MCTFGKVEVCLVLGYLRKQDFILKNVWLCNYLYSEQLGFEGEHLGIAVFTISRTNQC